MSFAINNDLYDEMATSWWDENGLLHLLKVMVNPWRVPYFAEILHQRFGYPMPPIRLLDIGCGGGVLTEEFARLGCAVTGIDVSRRSVQVARQHAKQAALSIAYHTAAAEHLPFGAHSFDVVSCCDALEHIRPWEQVIAEIGRVLKPGGLFLFDTINRTSKSKSAFIFGLQEWSFTKLFPRHTHVWEMFITPEELSAALEKQGMVVQGYSGGVIAKNPLATLREVRRYKSGKITVAELGRHLQLKHDPDLSLNYAGYAERI